VNKKLEVMTANRSGWFTRADALAAGYSDSEVRRRVRSGQWQRLCRDSYVEPRHWPTDEMPWERAVRVHLLNLRAASDRLGDVVVSHQSAAVVLGLPSWGFDLGRVHFTRSKGRIRGGTTVALHRSPLAPDEICEVDGLRLTTVERAITETTCSTSYEVGVVLADAALREGLTTPERLAAMVARHRYWPGSPAAVAAVGFADGASESVGESRLRVLMANHGLPAPLLQVEIRDNSGRLIGRVDFLLPGRLIVEFDGAVKYGDTADTVLAEKRREDRLREHGYRVIRVGWPDLAHPDLTATRLQRAMLVPPMEPAHRK
jgi:hypothetical protein